MSSIVKADKQRLTVRGVVDGHRYLVTPQGVGWWVEPAPEPKPRPARRQWVGPKRDLAEHLDALAKLGLTLTPKPKEVPSCRF